MATCEHLGHGWKVELLGAWRVLAIVVEYLNKFCEYRSLIEKALDRHLHLEFASGFEPDPELLPDTIHDQVGQVCFILVQMLKI